MCVSQDGDMFLFNHTHPSQTFKRDNVNAQCMHLFMYIYLEPFDDTCFDWSSGLLFKGCFVSKIEEKLVHSWLQVALVSNYDDHNTAEKWSRRRYDHMIYTTLFIFTYSISHPPIGWYSFVFTHCILQDVYIYTRTRNRCLNITPSNR